MQHESMRVREQRHRRIEDAEKRRQYRVAHGLEEPNEADKQKAVVQADGQEPTVAGGEKAEFVDWEGQRRPVKKWLGIW